MKKLLIAFYFCTATILLSSCTITTPTLGKDTMPTSEPTTNTGTFQLSLLDNVTYPYDHQLTGERVEVSTNEIRVILGGSSTCPPIIENNKLEKGNLQISLKSYPANMMCTADYQQRVYGAEYDPATQKVTTAHIKSSIIDKELKVHQVDNMIQPTDATS